MEGGTWQRQTFLAADWNWIAAWNQRTTAPPGEPRNTNDKERMVNRLARVWRHHWRIFAVAAALLASTAAMSGHAQDAAEQPPLERYLLEHDVEIALAKSAAPAHISDQATIKVLSAAGYEAVSPGDNGFVCMVMRGWTAPTYTPVELRDLVYDPTVLAPICFDPEASRSVLPYYELRTRLGMEGKSPDEIAAGVEAAYATGELPRRDTVSFAYMWSAGQNLIPGVGAWHPHMMVFAPYYENAMVGGNEFGSPLPQVSDDGGTPFSVVVIPVDHELAIEAVTAGS